jgi:hypothetical protein
MMTVNFVDSVRRLGVGAAKVEVRFEELMVEANVRVGRRALPTLTNCVINAAQVCVICSTIRSTWIVGSQCMTYALQR